MRRHIIIPLLMLLLPGASALSWSEIHFNPPGNDNGGEYIELLGNGSLEGCTVSDSASADTLVLEQQGNEIIMIVESDNSVPLPTNITIYAAGAAIGNGLGNTHEHISITCNSSTVLTTAYNISLMEMAEGQSLHYSHGWASGAPTPGTYKASAPAEDTNTPLNMTPLPLACNTTLHMTLNATAGTVGDTIMLQLFSAGYASFDATADGLPYASGDTLTTRTHPLALPNATMLKITATARECEGRQRAVRYVTILQPAASQEEQATQEKQATQEAQQVIAQPAEKEPAAVPTPVTTEQVIVDQDADAVPWIAAFGIVTVAASTTVFLQLLRRGQA